MIRAFVHDAGGLRATDAGAAAALAQSKSGIAWLDFADEPEHCADMVLETLHIHPLVREDMIVHANRPKVDNFGPYLYLVIHTARWDEDRPFMREIDIVLGERFLITYHEGQPRAIEAAMLLVQRRPELLEKGPAHLLHAILDMLVDQYLPIVDRIAEELDALEERIFDQDHMPASRKILELKRGTSALRRIVGPQRDTVLALTRDEFAAIPAALRPYLRDVYDRMARVSDLLDSFRDEIGTLLELHATMISNRLNEVIKRLTIVATIGLPLALITGWYGMNFDFAEYHWRWGFPYVVGLSLMTGAITWWILRRNKWL